MSLIDHLHSLRREVIGIHYDAAKAELEEKRKADESINISTIKAGCINQGMTNEIAYRMRQDGINATANYSMWSGYYIGVDTKPIEITLETKSISSIIEESFLTHFGAAKAQLEAEIKANPLKTSFVINAGCVSVNITNTIVKLFIQERVDARADTVGYLKYPFISIEIKLPEDFCPAEKYILLPTPSVCKPVPKETVETLPIETTTVDSKETVTVETTLSESS